MSSSIIGSVRVLLSSMFGGIGIPAEAADGEQAPSTASGGMMALTREPSCRRASTIGDDSSTRRPTRETMRSMICIRCWLSLKDRPVISSLPARST